MPSKVLVPLADGFEDIEAFTIIDVLRRGGVEVVPVGVTGMRVTSKYGMRVMLERRLMDVNPEEFDAVVLPGGSVGVANLSKSARLRKILRDFAAKGKLIGAICAAPLLLASEGILDDKRATVYPGLERRIPYPRDAKVVVDGNVVTSQGPGTAMEFALKLVEILRGKSVASRVRRELVVP